MADGVLLTVHTYRNAVPADTLARRFDRLGGALGRAPGNDLVLDDPSKYISRIHARVEYRDGGYWLVDVGSNPSLVNDKPVGTGRSAPLANGDRIAIGDYLLVAGVDSAGVAAPAALPPSPLQIDPVPADAPALPANPDDSLAGAGILNGGGDRLDSGADPLGLHLFGSAPPTAPGAQDWRGAESDHVPPEQMAFTPPVPMSAPVPAQTAARMAIPDDYDPLADFLPPRVQAPPPLQAPVAPPPAPALVAPAEATAIMPPAPAPNAQPAPAPKLPPLSTHSSGATADDPVLQALLRGLGVSDLHTKRSAEEIAELAGAMLREATAGTMGVLMGRALTKRESRLDMTMISAQANNPLKFFPDADSALTQMVGGAMPGYMAAPRAFANAFDDLKAHELAIMAGMRAALAGVLKRFDPQAIEARLQEPTVMDKVLAANRKAKMWDRMVELYAQMAMEADSDFQHLFGEAFGAAYEEQIERLRQARR
jgi:type VI secretion system FHA domain protein